LDGKPAQAIIGGEEDDPAIKTITKSSWLVSAPQIRIPDKLVPVFTGEAFIRGAHGGRGSAKTRTFAKMAAVKGLHVRRGGHGRRDCLRP
jgi:hypothetical protein